MVPFPRTGQSLEMRLTKHRAENKWRRFPACGLQFTDWKPMPRWKTDGNFPLDPKEIVLGICVELILAELLIECQLLFVLASPRLAVPHM